MSTEDDRMVLTEYERWRERTAVAEKDLSVRAFMALRQAEENAQRIGGALELLNQAIPESNWTQDGGDPAENYVFALDTLRNVRTLLTGDRNYETVMSLDGAVERIWTS